MIIKSWEDYKEFAFSTLGDFKDKDEDVLFLHLFENTGKLFGEFKKEILSGNTEYKPDELISIIGDLLWSCAVIEVQYGLMPSRASNVFKYDVKKSNDFSITVDLLLLQADFSAIITDLVDSAVEKDYDSMQYSINRFMSALLNISLYKEFSLKDSIISSCKKLQSFVKTPVTKTVKGKDYNKEYEEAKKQIKASKVKEVSIDILKDPSGDNQFIYKGIKVKISRKITKFETGELILDFFNASNSIAKQLPNQQYNLLYSPEFRVILENLISTNSIISAFLYEGTLIKASELKKKDANSPEIFMDKTKYRPVLIKPNMTELDHLLTYISDVKKHKAKKL